MKATSIVSVFFAVMFAPAIRLKILLVLMLLSGAVSGQVSRLNQMVEIKAVGLSFEAAVETFEKTLSIRVSYDPLLVNAGRKFDLNYRNVRGRVAFQDFLARAGLDYTESAGQFILKKRNGNEATRLYTLSGRVMHAESGEMLGNTSVSSDRNNVVSYSSDAGYFSVNLHEGINIISLYYPGFEMMTDTVSGDRNYFQTYLLKALPSDIPEVAIKGQNPISDATVNHGKTDEHSISSGRIRKFPHFLGEPDIIRVMSMFPGVVGGSEGMLGIYVRGGASDQNLVLLDDVPVFNSNHLYGIFSVFNDDAVKAAALLKGTFPAKYGGRLSSVINVQTKEGNNFRVKGAASVGLLASKLFLEGPLIRDRTTFTLAFRRSYLDFLATPLTRLFLFNDSLQNNIYYFWDLNARVTHRFSYRSRLSLSFYTGRDVGGIDERTESISPESQIEEKRQQLSSWGNLLGSVKWNYYPWKKTGITVKAHITEYNYSFDQNYEIHRKFTDPTKHAVNDETRYKLLNGIRDMEAGFLIVHRPGNYLALNGGGGITLHKFIPGNRTVSSSINGNQTELKFNDPTVNTPEIYSFGELTAIIFQKWYIDAGLRVSAFQVKPDFYYILPEPRMMMRYKFSENTWVKISAMRTRQFFHLLNNLSLGLPSDLWVPSVARFKPAKADQISGGFSHNFGKWTFHSEWFWKKLDHLLEYRENAGYITSVTNWEDAVTNGSGLAYGWEIMAEKTVGKLTGWASYTWMKNQREFQELNGGISFPSRYDRRHNLYLAGVYHVKKGVDISCSWVYNSGFAITTPVGKYLAPTPYDPYREIYLYGKRNNTRTRDNHRLDIAVNFEKKFEGRNGIPPYSRLWSLGVFNVYNRRNPFYVNMGYGKNGNRVYYQVSLLPVLPNISYRITF